MPPAASVAPTPPGTRFDPVRDRFRGALVGLAVGDALGATVEFKPRGTFRPPRDLVGGGPLDLAPGEWTDDTSQALCLAASLIECGTFDPTDCMRRLHRWMTKGYMSVTGKCFDIGASTARSLRGFGTDGHPYQGRSDRDSNGALMRLAPVPLAFAGDSVAAVRNAELSTRMTHGGKNTIAVSRYWAALLVGAVTSDDPESIFGAGTVHEFVYVPPGFRVLDWLDSLPSEVRDVAEGRAGLSLRAGYSAVECFHAALWAVKYATGLEDAITRAVSLGEDSDTAGAVAGQLAGAVWGHRAIPKRWTEKLAWHDKIVAAADLIYEMSGLAPPKEPVA